MVMFNNNCERNWLDKNVRKFALNKIKINNELALATVNELIDQLFIC